MCVKSSMELFVLLEGTFVKESEAVLKWYHHITEIYVLSKTE